MRKEPPLECLASTRPMASRHRVLRGGSSRAIMHVTIVAFMDADIDGAPVHAQWYPVVSFDDSNVLVFG